MADRRYTDEEVAEIFRRATVLRPESRVPMAATDGMTLAQLEAIAQEAGIEPSRITIAAREIDAPSAAPKRAVGVPISVSRSVELPREISEREWEFLVTRLRETFDATGKLESHGSLRTWSNSNLRVMLEPGISGHRVRFTSLNAGLRARIVGGSLAFGFGGITTLVAGLSGSEQFLAAFSTSGILAVIGAFVAAAAVGATKLWRNERRQQFDALAAELERLTRSS